MATSFWPQETPGHCYDYYIRLRDPVTPLNPIYTAKSQEQARVKIAIICVYVKPATQSTQNVNIK